MVPTSDQIEDLFRPRERWQSWLEVEAALATAQAELGMIPAEAGTEINRKAHLEHIDIEAMTAEMSRSKAPVLAMVHALANACDGDAGNYVHWGGTTQNIILTGRVLQIRKVHHAILASMANCFDAMTRLAEDGAEMTMAGRTNGQHALPITFGFKIAAWIEEFTRFETRFREIEPRIFSLVFGGAVGAMQAFGDKCPLLVRHMGRDLDLQPVTVPTRAMVDHFFEYISLLVLFGTSCSKIAREIFSLM
ncbi:MAG: lyase family protein, partial [Alphaproteobacteria bacterium]